MKHATKKKNRCTGCLALHHMSRYRKAEDFSKQHRQERFCKSSVSGAIRDEYPLRLDIVFKPSAPSAADRKCPNSSNHAKGSYWIREKGNDIEKIIERVSDLFSLSRQDILNPSRQRQRVMARSVLCYWAIRKLGMSGSELSHILGLNQSSVSRAVGRGEKHVNDRKLRLIEA